MKQYKICGYPANAWAYITISLILSFLIFAVIHDLHLERLRGYLWLVFAGLLFTFWAIGIATTSAGRKAAQCLAVELILISVMSQLLWANTWFYVFGEGRKALIVGYITINPLASLIANLIPWLVAYKLLKAESIPNGASRGALLLLGFYAYGTIPYYLLMPSI